MPHIYGFHALRALSVMLVIASHIGINGLFSNPAWTSFFVVFNANFGVKAFFVLSGFLITTILIGEHTATGTVSIFKFMMRRALRIFPLYFLAIAVVLVLVSFGIAHMNTKSVPYLVSFLYNFAPITAKTSYFNHFWSLAIEEQFYLVWPALFLVCIKKPGSLLIGSAAFVALCIYLDANRTWSLFISENPSRDWTVPKVYPIIIGCMLAISISRGDWKDAVQFALKSWPALFTALILLGLPLVFTLPQMTASFADASGIGLVIAWIYLNQHRPSVQALDWKPVAYIGMISYGLYVWQGILTGNGPYRYPGFPDFPISPPWLGAILTLPVSMVSFHFFERPLLNLKRHFDVSRQVVPTTELAPATKKQALVQA